MSTVQRGRQIEPVTPDVKMLLKGLGLTLMVGNAGRSNIWLWIYDVNAVCVGSSLSARAICDERIIDLLSSLHESGKVTLPAESTMVFDLYRLAA